MKYTKKKPTDIYLERAEQPDFCRLNEISDSFIVFLLLLEDSAFYSHKGYVLRFLWHGFIEILCGRGTHGYSTITQQLVKNLYFTFEKRIKRKILELPRAACFEKHLGKEQILELYINTIYYDNGQYGIRNASRFYFHCEPAALTDNQAFFLAALLPVVGIGNPLYQPEKFAEHRNRQLKKLEAYVPKEIAEEILRHGPDCLDEELCRAAPETDRYNVPGPMVNERFGPGGRESLTDTAAHRKKGRAQRNSPLAEYVRLSPNHSGQRTHGIDRITPHCAVKQVTVKSLGGWFSRHSTQASSNYGIDRYGRVGMYVMEKDCSWCSSDRENDQRAVTIECASGKAEPYKMKNEVYRTLIRLCTDICRRNGKKKLLWLEDKEKTLRYTPAPDEMVITVHRWFADRPCPGDWLYSRLGDLAEKVTAELSGGLSASAGVRSDPGAWNLRCRTPVRRAKRLVSEMTVDEKIGQILLLDFRHWTTAEEEDSGSSRPKELTELNDEIREIISTYHLGNILLFDENCADTKRLCKLTYDLQQTALAGGDLPLLIGTDQEGGDMTKLGSGTCLSGNMALGFSGDTANAYLAGRVIGSELKAVGINCVFAPVADINSNPDNPVMRTRSFSGNAELTAAMAAAMSEGFRSQGVISCAKHFPGHGDTETDSHIGLPMITVSAEEWYRREALPFRKLIRSGIPMIMTAHLQFPAMDETRYISGRKGETVFLPATLSRHIITNILKKKMGFQGVVVTDAMKMGAITQYFNPYIAAVMALLAGADLLCTPVTLRSSSDVAALQTLFSAIKNALDRGTLSRKRLDDAVTRVLTMKIRAGILDADYNYDVSSAADAADTWVGGSENRAIERRLADDCVKLVYSGTFKAFGTNDEKRTVFFMPLKDTCSSVLHAVRCMEKAGKTLNAKVFCYEGPEELTAEMLAGLKAADNLIVGSARLPGTSAEEAARMLAMFRKILSLAVTEHIAVICIGLPPQEGSFDDGYPRFLLANCSGMDSADIGREKFLHRYGPAIPAAVYRIFGVCDDSPRASEIADSACKYGTVYIQCQADKEMKRLCRIRR